MGEIKKCAWWTDQMQAVYDKSQVLTNTMRAGRPAPCCELARAAPCVCEISYICPVHGGRCHGSHD